jgi:hypothetical protein
MWSCSRRRERVGRPSSISASPRTCSSRWAARFGLKKVTDPAGSPVGMRGGADGGDQGHGVQVVGQTVDRWAAGVDRLQQLTHGGEEAVWEPFAIERNGLPALAVVPLQVLTPLPLSRNCDRTHRVPRPTSVSSVHVCAGPAWPAVEVCADHAGTSRPTPPTGVRRGRTTPPPPVTHIGRAVRDHTPWLPAHLRGYECLKQAAADLGQPEGGSGGSWE